MRSKLVGRYKWETIRVSIRHSCISTFTYLSYSSGKRLPPLSYRLLNDVPDPSRYYGFPMCSLFRLYPLFLFLEELNHTERENQSRGRLEKISPRPVFVSGILTDLRERDSVKSHPNHDGGSPSETFDGFTPWPKELLTSLWNNRKSSVRGLYGLPDVTNPCGKCHLLTGRTKSL